MERRGLLRALLVLTGGLAVGGCGQILGNRYRFRMIVEADTPEGSMSGSSVYEVWAASTFKLLPEEGARIIEVTGQALVLDLPGGPVFVLMQPQGMERSRLAEMSMVALDPEFHGWADSVDSAARLNGWRKRTGEVPRAYWPLMVRFRDLNDPASVMPVEPETVGIRRIVVETTRDKVSTGIIKMLPWLSDGGASLDPDGGPVFNPTFAQTVARDAFTREIRR